MPKPAIGEWRAFEQMIARTEVTFSPAQATVRCPDRHVIDLDDGEFREVDATIRYTTSAESVLVALECRRRGRRQDMRWIEELVGKKQSIGAKRMVAVARGGFSKRAIHKGRVRGIELKSVRELNASNLADWIAMKAVELVGVRWSVLSVYFCASEMPQGAVVQFPGGARLDADAPWISVEQVDRLVSLHAFIQAARENSKSDWPTSSQGESVKERLNIVCNVPAWVPTDQGLVQVSRVQVECVSQRTVDHGPISAAFEYRQYDEIPYEVVQFDLTSALPDMYLVLRREPNGMGTVSVVRNPSASTSP